MSQNNEKTSTTVLAENDNKINENDNKINENVQLYKRQYKHKEDTYKIQVRLIQTKYIDYTSDNNVFGMKIKSKSIDVYKNPDMSEYIIFDLYVETKKETEESYNTCLLLKNYQENIVFNYICFGQEKVKKHEYETAQENVKTLKKALQYITERRQELKEDPHIICIKTIIETTQRLLSQDLTETLISNLNVIYEEYTLIFEDMNEDLRKKYKKQITTMNKFAKVIKHLKTS